MMLTMHADMVCVAMLLLAMHVLPERARQALERWATTLGKYLWIVWNWLAALGVLICLKWWIFSARRGRPWRVRISHIEPDPHWDGIEEVE